MIGSADANFALLPAAVPRAVLFFINHMTVWSMTSMKSGIRRLSPARKRDPGTGPEGDRYYYSTPWMNYTPWKKDILPS